MSAPEAARQRLLLLAEGTLAALTVTAVLGLGRLFVDGSFLPQVVLAAIAAHTTAALCRRRKLGLVPTVLVAIVAGTVLTTWFQLGETTMLGLPTGETLSQARADLADAWSTFGEVVAPAPVLPGFVLAASLGVWVIAFAADSAAFRARAMVEAVVPATTLFVFGGALGTGEHRLVVSALFLAAGLGHWLAQRSLAAAASPTWLSSEQGGGARSLLRLGAGLAAIGVLASVTIGPNLPGADARAVIPWRASDRDGPDSRVTISPLVDIRSRLVDQADLEVFRVSATERSYWRLTSLERFDGRRWTSDREYGSGDGELGSDVDTSAAGVRRSVQKFTVSALSVIWLPAAFRPIRVEGVDASYDTDSNSLLTPEETAAGLSYTVESALPVMDADQLQGVPAQAPGDLAARYTSLPVDFSPEVQALAGRVTGGALTQYERARALQDFFRREPFVYDLEVEPGHSGNDLEQFLFETRRGYCEQYAGAYAAMARAIGLPARVAVGFTPGEVDQETGEYVVRGYNGHAWPEVYLDGFGWVSFEPTPGRGAPGAEGWTGVPESQAQEGNPGTGTTLPTTTSTTVAGGGPTTLPNRIPQEDPFFESTEAPSPWPGRILVAAIVAVVVPLLWAAALGVAKLVRRRRRRAAAATPGERVLVAWEEVTEALGRAGTPAQRWETPDEFARRASEATGVDARLFAGLAGLTTTASFGRGEVPEEIAEQAAEVAEKLERAADALVPGRERLRFLVDPRPLLPERDSRVDVREGV